MLSSQNRTVRFGPFELDIQIGELRKNNTRLKLQGQPIQILEMLLAKPGELVTREEIQQRLWPADTFVDFDHSLNTAIKKLRQALGDEADAPCYVATLPKRGYRFIGKVDRDIAIVLPEAVLGPAAQETGGSRRVPWSWVLAVSCTIVLLATVGGLIYLAIRPTPLPTITASHHLVKNAYPKPWPAQPLTDGRSIYFQEDRPSGLATLQVPVTGGEVSEIPAVNGWLTDISSDGSKLLFYQRDDPQRFHFNVWTQPLPAGRARLIVKDARWPLWTEDGRHIFFVRNLDTELYRANADGTGVQHLATFPSIHAPRLAPDGSLIRYAASDSAPYKTWEVRSDGSNPHPILAQFEYVYGGAWSPDGKLYFFSAFDGDRYNLWAVGENWAWWRWPWWRKISPVPAQLTFGPASYWPPTFSKDGKQIYASGVQHQGELSVYDPSSGRFVPYLGGISACFVDFSRDGKWMAYVTYPEGTLWRSKLDGSEKMQLTSPTMAVINPRWSPDGKLIAFTDQANGDRSKMDDTTPGRVYVIGSQGGAPELLLAGQVGDPTWSPDGKRIAYAGTAEGHPEVRILDLQTQKSTKIPGSEGMWSPRWSPDGRYLVALGNHPGGPAGMILFTFASLKWQDLALSGGGWECWSHDSKFIYAEEDSSLIRIDVAKRSKEHIASLASFRSTAYYFDRSNGGWFGLSPDDRPISTRDTGIEGIYAFDLAYK